MNKRTQTDSEERYYQEYTERKAAGTLPKGANLRALEEWAGLKGPPYWYRGKKSTKA